MPYDITDAFLEIKELQQTMNKLLELLVEKGIIEKPKEVKNEENKEGHS